MSSTRLPGKVMQKIGDRTVIEHIYYQVSKTIDQQKIIIATSTHITDQPIADLCIRKGWQHYRGSLENVAERFLDCANEHKLDYGIRINGDNLFVNIDVLKKIVELSNTGQLHFVTNVPGRTFPIGMSVESLHIPWFRNLHDQFSKYDQEHITIWLYNHLNELENVRIIENKNHPFPGIIHLALDNHEDLEKAKWITEKLGQEWNSYNYTLDKLITLCKEYEHLER
jgi:spore coat polysaccharide biosynthesis protein SpsF